MVDYGNLNVYSTGVNTLVIRSLRGHLALEQQRRNANTISKRANQRKQRTNQYGQNSGHIIKIIKRYHLSIGKPMKVNAQSDRDYLQSFRARQNLFIWNAMFYKQRPMATLRVNCITSLERKLSESVTLILANKVMSCTRLSQNR